MLYAHFIGFVSDVQLALNDTPFAKCLVRTTSGEDLIVHIFGENDLNSIDEDTLIQVKQVDFQSGRWKGFKFLNGKPVGFRRIRFPKPMDFSIANGFNLSSLN